MIVPNILILFLPLLLLAEAKFEIGPFHRSPPGPISWSSPTISPNSPTSERELKSSTTKSPPHDHQPAKPTHLEPITPVLTGNSESKHPEILRLRDPATFQPIIVTDSPVEIQTPKPALTQPPRPVYTDNRHQDSVYHASKPASSPWKPPKPSTLPSVGFQRASQPVHVRPASYVYQPAPPSSPPVTPVSTEKSVSIDPSTLPPIISQVEIQTSKPSPPNTPHLVLADNRPQNTSTHQVPKPAQNPWVPPKPPTLPSVGLLRASHPVHVRPANYVYQPPPPPPTTPVPTEKSVSIDPSTLPPTISQVEIQTSKPSPPNTPYLILADNRPQNSSTHQVPKPAQNPWVPPKRPMLPSVGLHRASHPVHVRPANYVYQPPPPPPPTTPVPTEISVFIDPSTLPPIISPVQIQTPKPPQSNAPLVVLADNKPQDTSEFHVPKPEQNSWVPPKPPTRPSVGLLRSSQPVNVRPATYIYQPPSPVIPVSTEKSLMQNLHSVPTNDLNKFSSDQRLVEVQTPKSSLPNSLTPVYSGNGRLETNHFFIPRPAPSPWRPRKLPTNSSTDILRASQPNTPQSMYIDKSRHVESGPYHRPQRSADARDQQTWNSFVENLNPQSNILELAVTTAHPGRNLHRFMCPQPYGYFKYTDQCDEYIECKNYVPLAYICPNGLHFNPEMEWTQYPCDHPSNVQCNEEPIPPPTTASPVTTPAPKVITTPRPNNQKPDFMCPQPHGYFKFSDQCGEYVECKNYVPLIFTCPVGLHFNPLVEWTEYPCEHPSIVQCDEEPNEEKTPKPTPAPTTTPPLPPPPPTTTRPPPPLPTTRQPPPPTTRQPPPPPTTRQPPSPPTTRPPPPTTRRPPPPPTTRRPPPPTTWRPPPPPTTRQRPSPPTTRPPPPTTRRPPPPTTRRPPPPTTWRPPPPPTTRQPPPPPTTRPPPPTTRRPPPPTTRRPPPPSTWRPPPPPTTRQPPPPTTRRPPPPTTRPPPPTTRRPAPTTRLPPPPPPPPPTTTPQPVITPGPKIPTDYDICLQPHGYFKFSDQCDEYIECKNYVPLMFTCPVGLHFNPLAEWTEYPCDHPSKVQCSEESKNPKVSSTTSAPTTPIPVVTTPHPGSKLHDFECPQAHGYFKYNDQCSEYIECKDHVPLTYTCPDGLHFNVFVDWTEYPCDHPSNVQCDKEPGTKQPTDNPDVTSRPTVGTPQPTAVTQPPVTSNTPRIPTQGTVRPPNKYPIGFYCQKPNAYYSVASQCDSYIECESYKAFQRSCPAGLHFNPKAKWPSFPCDYPSRVQCNGPLIGPTVGTPQPTIETPRPPVQPPRPIVRPPDPTIETPRPIVRPPDPTIETPRPPVQPPRPVVRPPQPTIETPQPPVQPPRPIVRPPDPTIETPRPPVQPPRPIVRPPQPTIETPQPPVQPPQPPVQPPRPIVRPPQPTIETPQPPVQSPRPPVQPPQPPVQPPQPPVQPPQPPVQPPRPIVRPPRPTIETPGPTVRPPRPTVGPSRPTQPTVEPPRPSVRPPRPIVGTPRPNVVTPYTPRFPTQATVKPPPSKQPFNYSCPDLNGFYSVASQCDIYVECMSGIAIEHSCPDGLHFNPNAQWPDYPCGYPSEVNCNSGDVVQQPNPTAECPHRDGFFPTNSSDCGEYMVCHAGVAIIEHCPAGLVFNFEKDTCDWPINVPGCNQARALEGFVCPVPLVDNAGLHIYKYRYGRSCKNFVACQEGQPRLLSCDPGLHFDEGTESCVDSELVLDCDE